MSDQNQEKIVYINYVDGIDLKKVKNLMAVIANIYKQEKPDTLYFSISSGGGDVDSGISLYNFLKSFPCKIIMHNTGSIDSIANVVFMAGDERFATKFTTFLFHGVRLDTNGPSSFHLNQLNEMRDRMEKMHGKIADIVCLNSTLKKKNIQKLFLEGKTEDTKFALKWGIIQEVKDFVLPKNALFVSLNHI